MIWSRLRATRQATRPAPPTARQASSRLAASARTPSVVACVAGSPVDIGGRCPPRVAYPPRRRVREPSRARRAQVDARREAEDLVDVRPQAAPSLARSETPCCRAPLRLGTARQRATAGCASRRAVRRRQPARRARRPGASEAHCGRDGTSSAVGAFPESATVGAAGDAGEAGRAGVGGGGAGSGSGVAGAGAEAG